jgi:hypothetical protein
MCIRDINIAAIMSFAHPFFSLMIPENEIRTSIDVNIVACYRNWRKVFEKENICQAF